MDWARVAGSFISLFLGGAFSDSDNPDAPAPDFTIDTSLATDPPPVAEEQPPLETQTPAPVEEKSVAPKWSENLSPEGRAIVAKAMAGGAAGLMGAIAQKNAEEDRRDREERAREDKKRRGSIQAFGANAYAPIIGSRM